MLIGKAFLFCTLFTTLLIILSPVKSLFPARLERLVYGILGTFAALLATFIFVKAGKKSFGKTGIAFHNATINNFFIGLMSGVLLMAILTGTVILASGFRIEPNTKSTLSGFFFLAVPLLPLAFMEEVAFRGYPFRLLKNAFSVRSTLLITSLLFALYHIANGWTIQNSFLGPGSWGIIFGLAAMRSNGISMPTGLHYGVNLTTSVFGINESPYHLWVLKQSDGKSLEAYQSSVPEILLPQIGILLFAIALMEVYIRRK